MKVDKFYTLPFNIAKLIVAALIPVLSQISALFISDMDSLISLVIVMFISAVLYVIPFITTLFMLRHYKVKTCKRYIKLDAVYILAPVLMSAILCEVVDCIKNGVTVASGSFIIIFGILYILISLAFWGLYALAACVNRY